MADTANGGTGRKPQQPRRRPSGTRKAPRAVADDLSTLMLSSGIAALVLDLELRLAYFTPAITRILNLIPSDVGRPIGDLTARFSGYDLPGDARDVARGGPEIEREERLLDGASFLVRVMPYRDRDGRVTGVVATFNDVTRLRRAEEQTARLAAVLADSNDAVILFDLAGRITTWNRGAECAYGWTEAEALQLNIRDLVPVEEVAGLTAMIGRLAAGETVTSVETRRRTRAGELLDVWQTITPLRDPAGRVTAVAATERDVTARYRAQQELHAFVEVIDRQQRQLEAVMSALPVGVAITDERGGTVRVNGEFDRIWGGPRPRAADVGGYTAYRAWWADTGVPVQPEEWASARAVGAGQAVFGQLMEIERFDGQRRTVINSGAPIRDAAGRIVGSAVAIMDISALREAQQLLQHSQNRLALAASATRIGMFDWDLSGGEVLWTQTHESIFGYAPPVDQKTTMTAAATETRQFTYRTWADRVHPEDLPRVEAEVRRSRADCSPLETQYRVVWPDGNVHWVESRCAFLCDAHGKPLRMLGVVMDITERKRGEEALQRTAGLLARSNKDLEHFAYVASHDLQEPLRMVTGFLDLLKARYEGQLDAKAERWIRHAVDGARRMSALIDDLLAFSRVDRLDQKIVPTSAQKALNRALVNLRAGIESTGARITHDALPTVLADSLQLSLLFQNLISNALKFKSEDGPCEIHVGARRDGAQIELFVRDNGIGIPPQQNERIFLIFQRLHTRGKYPGTGIGLAICKRIVERHGGRIWVESKPGEGATFFFTLSAAEAAGPPR